MYLLSGLSIINLYSKGFCYLINIVTLTESIIKPMILTKLIFAYKKVYLISLPGFISLSP